MQKLKQVQYKEFSQKTVTVHMYILLLDTVGPSQLHKILRNTPVKEIQSQVTNVYHETKKK